MGSLATTVFPLPSLRPPMDELIALLQLPAMAKLHIPLTMKLIIRNRHAFRAANITVQLDTDPTDGFVIAGLRSGRMPILLPGGECTLVWKLIPVECGFIRVPKIKVVDRRKAVIVPSQETPNVESAPENDAPGDIIKIVDVRWDGRDAEGQRDIALGGPTAEKETSREDLGAILIVP